MDKETKTGIPYPDGAKPLILTYKLNREGFLDMLGRYPIDWTNLPLFAGSLNDLWHLYNAGGSIIFKYKGSTGLYHLIRTFERGESDFYKLPHLEFRGVLESDGAQIVVDDLDLK